MQRFRSVLTEYQRRRRSRDRLYLETMQQVYGNVTQVMVDSRSGSNLLYLPLDRLLQQAGVGARRHRSRSCRRPPSPRQPVPAPTRQPRQRASRPRRPLRSRHEPNCTHRGRGAGGADAAVVHPVRRRSAPTWPWCTRWARSREVIAEPGLKVKCPAVPERWFSTSASRRSTVQDGSSRPKSLSIGWLVKWRITRKPRQFIPQQRGRPAQPRSKLSPVNYGPRSAR